MNQRTAPASSTTPEELIVNIHRLMDEVEAIMARQEGAASGEDTEEAGNLRERLSFAIGRLGEFCQSAKRSVVDRARKTDESIREHPYRSLAIALGVGVLVGAFARRRRVEAT